MCVVLYLLWFGVYVDFEAFEGGGGSEGFLKGGAEEGREQAAHNRNQLTE